MKKYYTTYKNILKIAIPVMLSQLGQVTVQLADNMMVGKVGTTELAAASFANNIFVLGMLFSLGVTMGLTPLIGKAFLKKDNNKIASLLKNGLFCYSALAVVVPIILFIVSFFLHKMGQPMNVVEVATPYFYILIASLFPLLIFSTFKQFLEGIGNTKVAMIITLGANSVNILFNYLLIYGKLGFPEMGLMGAGVSTLMSRIIMPIAIVIYFKKSKSLSKYWNLAKQATLTITSQVKLLKIGIPIGGQVTFEVLVFSFAGIMMGWLGENALAAHQAALSVTTASYMISLGVGSAATIRVSHAFGVANFKQIRRIVIATLHLTLAMMGTMGIIFIIFRDQLPMLFSNDPEVITIASSLFVIAALFQLFDSAQVALLATLRGLSDVTYPMILAFISYMLVGIPVSYVSTFIFNLGPVGIWLGLLSGLAFAAVLFGIRIVKLINKLELEHSSK